MIKRRELLARARCGEMLDIRVKHDNLLLRGLAWCDTVSCGKGAEKIRAKFPHGVKAILDMEDYAEGWKAYNIKLTDAQTQAAGGGLPAASAGGGSRQGENGRAEA